MLPHPIPPCTSSTPTKKSLTQLTQATFTSLGLRERQHLQECPAITQWLLDHMRRLHKAVDQPVQDIGRKFKQQGK